MTSGRTHLTTSDRLPVVTRFLFRFLLLTSAVAFVTYGLATWQHEGFGLDGVWLFGDGGRLHPLHFVVVGIGMIPPTMWEIFALNAGRRDASRRTRQQAARLERGDDG